MQGYPSLELRPEVFGRISATIQELAGIRMPRGKETLVRSRLTKRLRALGLTDFDAYLDYLDADTTGTELREMVDALATNKTSFFREAAHFDHLVASAFPAFEAARQAPRVWSAGCSTGEEPYTLAMLMREHLTLSAPLDARILATDISGKALRAARLGEYPAATMSDVPASLLQRYFNRTPSGSYSADVSLRSLIAFARLNLMDTWPMKGPFDVIFCRNVMIYFDREARERLVGRFWSLLREGGTLYVGHSESLSGLRHAFTYVQPAVYRR
jgi:chemotaxis protein methyltransferase CheR